MSGADRDSRARVLVVDDDPVVARSLSEFITEEGHTGEYCTDGREVLDRIAHAAQPASASDRSSPFDVVFCDVSMPDISGLDLLRRITEAHPEVSVIMLTGYGTIESAVEALRLGAVDYLSKPVIDAEIRMALQRALRQQALVVENISLKNRLDERFGLENVIGTNHQMARACELAKAVAESRATVLINGESGTGKSMLARAIHQRSDRRDKPFVEIFCGSVPEALLESELFGHVRGAFTGAHSDKQGRFLAADTGTIFIDEINSASPGMQLKLLRVLQERTFEPIGSNETIEVDVRVILASNQPLEELVAAGEFRQDLYYRINVVSIDVPALRERTGDIPQLIDHFLRKYSAEYNKQVTGLDDKAIDALQRYDFPGNVRELENIIERAVVLSTRPTLGIDDLPPNVVDGRPGLRLVGGSGDPDDEDAPWEPIPLAEALKEPEKRILLKALKANDWNRQATADQLQINRTTLYKKIKAYRLDRLAG